MNQLNSLSLSSSVPICPPSVNTPEPRQETEPETTTTTAAVTVADPAQSPAPPTADVTSRPATSEGGERVDSRAEAAQVIPVTPPPGPDAKKAEIDGAQQQCWWRGIDGRSLQVHRPVELSFLIFLGVLPTLNKAQSLRCSNL